MHIKIRVISGGKNIGFTAIAHKADSPSAFYLDPTGFYGKWGKTIPQGDHWELEIIEPGSDFFLKHKLHIHRSSASLNPFVCYPWHIQTIKRAQAIFRIWCLGTVGTVEHSVDLNTTYSQQCGGDETKFVNLMRGLYGVYVADEKLEHALAANGVSAQH